MFRVRIAKVGGCLGCAQAAGDGGSVTCWKTSLSPGFAARRDRIKEEADGSTTCSDDGLAR